MKQVFDKYMEQVITYINFKIIIIHEICYCWYGF